MRMELNQDPQLLLLYLQHGLTSFHAIDVISGYDLGNETTQ